MIKTGDRVTWEEKVHPGKGNKTPWYKATFIGTVKFYGPARCQVITDSGEERYPLTSKLKGTRA